MNIQLFENLLNQARPIWVSGGVGMIALAVNALVMFGMGLYVLMRLLDRGVYSSPDKAFHHWKDGKRVKSPLGHVVASAMALGSQENMDLFFEGLRNREIVPFFRDLKVLGVSVATAPLLGLLGTVTGMLATFSALATGGGGDKTMGMVAGGISEALVTTETGLVLGLAGLMFEFILKRKHENLIRKYTRIETLCLEALRRPEKVARQMREAAA